MSILWQMLTIQREEKNRAPALMELQFYGETDIFRNDTSSCIIIEMSIQKNRNVFLRSREQENLIQSRWWRWGMKLKAFFFSCYWNIVALQLFSTMQQSGSATCRHISPSFLDFLPIFITAEHWIEFSELYSRFSLVICFISSVQFSSVAQSCLTLCDRMNHSTPGLPVHHQLPGLTQTHVHRASNAIQPSQPLSSPFLLAPNPSQHQSLFQWVNSSHEVAKVLEFQH